MTMKKFMNFSQEKKIPSQKSNSTEYHRKLQQFIGQQKFNFRILLMCKRNPFKCNLGSLNSLNLNNSTTSIICQFLKSIFKPLRVSGLKQQIPLSDRILCEKKEIDDGELHTGIKKKCKSLRRAAQAMVKSLAPGAFSPKPGGPLTPAS